MKKIFTFQYGSTLIESDFTTVEATSKFTFQYGSTLMLQMMY